MNLFIIGLFDGLISSVGLCNASNIIW